MNKNRVMHFEIGAEDPKELSAFYQKAFGWEINEMGDSGYFMVGKMGDLTPGAINGGIMKRFENEKTINTIIVEDIDQAIKDVTDNGGKVVKPKAAMAGYMWWSYMADPQGNVFGLSQMDETAK